jgi:hypothetical protein
MVNGHEAEAQLNRVRCQSANVVILRSALCDEGTYNALHRDDVRNSAVLAPHSDNLHMLF